MCSSSTMWNGRPRTDLSARHLHMIKFFVLTLTLGLATSTAQEVPRFTVASIKPSADNEPGMVVQPMAAGRYYARKVPLIALLTAAYDLSPDRIVGAPQWR